MNQSGKFNTPASSRTHGENGLACVPTASMSACSETAALPQAKMDRIIYCYSKPNDLVFDPFARTGATVDACKRLSRRCYCSDLYVYPGREQELKAWDITQGLPPDLPNPDLVILDPPYPKPGPAQFARAKNDMRDMRTPEFNASMRCLIEALSARNVSTIVFVLPPVLSAEVLIFRDERCDFRVLLAAHYKLVQYNLVVCPPLEEDAHTVGNANDMKGYQRWVRDTEVWQARKQ